MDDYTRYESQYHTDNHCKGSQHIKILGKMGKLSINEDGKNPPIEVKPLTYLGKTNQPIYLSVYTMLVKKQ